MTENKEIMAKNIKRQMEIKGVKATDVCEALGFKHNTFSDWINAKSYPRIDKIELMSNYFNISKIELIEEPEMHKAYMLEAESERLFAEIKNMDYESRKDLIRRLFEYEADLLKGGD